MTVKEYITKATQQPFEWGISDCCLFPSDWVYERTGYDPASSWRGSYSTSREAYHFIRRSGGMVKLCSDSMSRFKKIDTIDVKDGDVGVVDGYFEVSHKQTWNILAASIYVGGLWIVRSHKSLIGCKIPYITVVAAWRID